MTLNYVAMLVATVAQFILGAIWYMPIFGKTWGKIHGIDVKSEDEVKIAQKQMVPFLIIQIIITFVTTLVLDIFITYIPTDWNAYGLAGLIWIGFFVPTQIGAVIFGGTKSEWMVKKILIMSGASAICLLAGTFVLKMM